jgi:hypothetical protein
MGKGRGEKLFFSISEENFGGYGTPTFCGDLEVIVEDLLANIVGISNGVMATRELDLPFHKRGENTGTLKVQAVVTVQRLQDDELTRRTTSRTTAGCLATPVSAAMFVTPVKRLGVSGGTAPFFRLELQSLDNGASKSKWIGKDLSRATDEISFYEEKMSLERSGGHAMDSLFSFMFEYAGVLTCPEAGVAAESADLELLVLQNLHDKMTHLRMVDIKVGEKTAAANWQGKSRFAALRQSVVDGLTNSAAEGFRLEGFDGLPQALQSMDPLHDFTGMRTMDEATRKKARRYQMQRMPAAEMFVHLMDLHRYPDDRGPIPEQLLHAELTPIELGEIVMSEFVEKLTKLSIACQKSPTPHKWIGSSVALGFDDQCSIPRGKHWG